MKALVLNALDRDTLGYESFDILTCELQQYAIIVDTVNLHEVAIHPCKHCYHCWTKTPGLCVVDDMGREIARVMLQNEVTIILAQSVNGEIQHIVRQALERTIPNFSVPRIRDQYLDLAVLAMTEHSDLLVEERHRENVRRLGIDFHCVHTTAIMVEVGADSKVQQAKIAQFIAEVFMKRNSQ